MLLRGYEQVDWPWQRTGNVAHRVVAEITGIPGGRAGSGVGEAFEESIHRKAAHPGHVLAVLHTEVPVGRAFVDAGRAADPRAQLGFGDEQCVGVVPVIRGPVLPTITPTSVRAERIR